MSALGRKRSDRASWTRSRQTCDLPSRRRSPATLGVGTDVPSQAGDAGSIGMGLGGGDKSAQKEPSAEEAAEGLGKSRSDEHYLVMSTSLVSGRKSRPTTKLMAATTSGIPEARVDIAGGRDDGEDGGGQEAAEPAIADMVGQRQAAVADAGREQLDQPGRDRAVDHGHVDDEDRRAGPPSGSRSAPGRPWPDSRAWRSPSPSALCERRLVLALASSAMAVAPTT